METKDYEASILQPKKVTIINTTNNEFDLQMYRVNLQLLIGGRSSKYPDGQEVEFLIESSEEYVYYASVIENLGDEWNIDNNHKISIAFEDAGGGSAVLIEKSVTANGVYNASDDEADGYSKVTVNVPAPVSAKNIAFDFSSYFEQTSSTTISQDWLSSSDQKYYVTEVNIPNTTTEIGDYAFDNFHRLTTVTIPSSVTTIGAGAFFECPLTTITIPGSVTEIDNSAFASEYGDLSLHEVIFETPSSVETIGGQCFEYSSITSVTIPNSVTTLGYQCFSNCSFLTTVIFEATSQLTEIGDSCFSGASLTSIEIPSSVETIGERCFEATSITSVTIPNSVTTLGYQCFYGCSALKSVSLSNQLTELGDSVFRDSGIESITLPNTLTTIGADCFRGTSLTQITIPSSIETIGEDCFSDCSALETITINKAEDSIAGAPWGAPETTQIIWNG